MTEKQNASNDSQKSAALAKLINRPVVLDLRSEFVVIGTLIGEDHRYLILKDADVHDLRETTTTRDAYALEVRKFGVQPNRKRALIRHEEVASLSALEDIPL